MLLADEGSKERYPAVGKKQAPAIMCLFLMMLLTLAGLWHGRRNDSKTGDMTDAIPQSQRILVFGE